MRGSIEWIWYKSIDFSLSRSEEKYMNYDAYLCNIEVYTNLFFSLFAMYKLR